MPYNTYGTPVFKPFGPKIVGGYGNSIVGPQVTNQYLKPNGAVFPPPAKPQHGPVTHQVIPSKPAFVPVTHPPVKPKFIPVPNGAVFPPPAKPQHGPVTHQVIPSVPEPPPPAPHKVIIVKKNEEKPKPKPRTKVIIVEKTKEEPRPETKTFTIKGTENEDTTTQCSTADGLIIAGSTLTGLSIAFAFTAFIVPKVALIVSAPFFALGLTLLGIGIYLKTREKKKGPLGSVKEARNNSVNNNINVNINQSQSQNQSQEEK